MPNPNRLPAPQSCLPAIDRRQVDIGKSPYRRRDSAENSRPINSLPWALANGAVTRTGRIDFLLVDAGVRS